MFRINAMHGISLDAAGLVALADLKIIQTRTALTGTSSYFDVLLLAPGIHCQQHADEVNGGEYPQAGELNKNSYLFRIENPATVSWLQGISKPWHLTEVTVKACDTSNGWLGRVIHHEDVLPTLLYSTGLMATVMVITLLIIIHDWWRMGVLLMLVTARLVNTRIIKQRSEAGWKGIIMPDNRKSDLLIILSQDRWVRIRGRNQSVKKARAGCWLRDMTVAEKFGTGVATILVYASAALAGNASTVGSLMIACLLLFSAGLLGLVNSITEDLHMFGQVCKTKGSPIPYLRRIDMVDALIKETGTDEWAVSMNLIPPAMNAERNISIG
jgi:hypothetical protein